MDERIERLEMRVAEVLRAVDDLSATVAQQAREIDVLNRRVAMLMQREAERESAASGGAIYADERPPHY